MAKVLLINPVVREEAEPKHVPYGLALLASIAIDRGHQVQIYDANAWRKGPEVLRQVCEADDWDVIGTGGITTAYASIKEIVRVARSAKPSAVIMLGGGVLTSLPHEIMTWLPQVDVGVIGEAFVTFPELLDRIDHGNRTWHQVDGTISRAPNGQFVLSPQRSLIEDLDTLPYPAWDLFPLEEVYFPNSAVLYSEESMLAQRRLDINGSFGCSMICRYCYHLGLAGDMRYEREASGEIRIAFDEPGSHTRTNRYHSPEYVVGLAKHAYDKYNVDFLAFLDENLMTMNRISGGSWLREICRLWKEYGLQPDYLRDGRPRGEAWTGVHWSGTSHATLVDPEILSLMKEVGCTYLIYGYESFSPHVMKTIGKGSTPKTNIRSFFRTLEAGIRPVPNQIIGFPIEDFDSIRQNMEAWEKLGIVVKPFFATPYPGSEWFTVHRKDIEAQYSGDLEKYILDLGDATKVTAVISKNFNAVELLGLREMMINLQHDKIDQYERVWRQNHRIPVGEPSTLCEPKRDSKPRLKVVAS